MPFFILKYRVNKMLLEAMRFRTKKFLVNQNVGFISYVIIFCKGMKKLTT